MDVIYPIVDNVYYLVAYCGGEISGMFVVYPVNAICYDCHSSILPHAYGEPAKKLGKMAIDWVFTNTKAMKLVGSTPTTNKLAIKYSMDIGFEREGINRKSIMKNGSLVDQVYFGLEREKWALKQQ